MEKEIKRIVRRLWVEYLLVWLLALAIVLLYEAEVMEEGLWAHDGQICYLLQTAVVLLTLCAIPASLKMFGLVMERRVSVLPHAEALVSYQRWSEIRLALIAIVVFVGLSVYYTTLSSIGGLCALVALLASFFCLPGADKLKHELKMDDAA